MTDRKPRIGILGIMQDLYDEMIPGIAQRQAGYAAQIAAHLADVGEFIPSKPVKYREDAEREMRAFEHADLDGVMVVMLTYGPAMRVARLLAESRLPILMANIQPEPNVTPAWDMADMTYNQGVHGAQDTANSMVRAGRRFCVLTDDWRAGSFRADVHRWARAAAAVTAWRRLKVALFGYAMNDMGDIRVDESALVRSLGPEILAVAPGDLYRGMAAAGEAAVREVIAFEDANFEIDPRLSAEEREDHARMQVAIENILVEGGFGAYTAHFDAIGQDGRFRRPPLAAASTLMAKGYGYAAEGHRAPGRPADVPVPVPAGPGDAGHPGLAGRRAVPPGRRRGGEPGHPGASRPGDALRAVPPRDRGPGLPERVAGGGRPAPRGDEPGPPRRRLARPRRPGRHRVRPGLSLAREAAHIRAGSGRTARGCRGA